MALNIDTQDIDLYPGTVKRVTVDQGQIVPQGFEGDEQFVVTVGTSAYSDNTLRTAIQDIYITDFDAGWCKSTGFAGTGGKFPLDTSNNQLKVKMDATVSGTDQSTYYNIILDHSSGIGLTGEVVAADMEAKIRAIECETADAGYQLAYTNASVEFQNGKFWIISGTIGRYYSGVYRSSVAVTAADSNDCSVMLGFDMPMTSEALDAVAVGQALLTSDYTTDTATMNIGTGAIVVDGDCILVKDSTGNTDTCQVISASGTVLTVPTNGTNSFTGIANSYTTANGAYIQVLQEQDPEVTPTTWFTDVDRLIRFGIKSIINQIDYSS